MKLLDPIQFAEKEIPPCAFPDTVNAIQMLVRDAETSLGQIAALIKQEPVLAARFLKVANSAAYGLRSQVSNVDLALVVIGINNTAQMVQSLAMLSAFSSSAPPAFLKELFRRCLVRASLCASLGRALGRKTHDDEYTAGLVCDIGFAAMAACAPEHFTVLWQRGDLFSMGCEEEKKLVGIDHCEAGSAVARCWGLPGSLARSIGEHHGPMRGDGAFSLPGLVRLAVVMAENLEGREIDESCSVVLPEGHFWQESSLEGIMTAFEEQAEDMDQVALAFLD